jgi:hypothetical protein
MAETSRDNYRCLSMLKSAFMKEFSAALKSQFQKAELPSKLICDLDVQHCQHAEETNVSVNNS